MSRGSARLRTAVAGVFVGILAILAVGTDARADVSSVSAVPGAPVLVLSDFDLAPFGYTVEEFVIAGTAQSYKLDATATADGPWQATASETAPYVTRLVVARPREAAKFNGTVVVEWLNVSTGVDAAPEWNAAHREMLRRGYAYVAVSAQKVGIEGGAGVMGLSGAGLKQSNPERYDRLSHPGDAFAYDIYSQAGQLTRNAQTAKILGPLAPKRLIAVGESQSAMFLTTYANVVDPLAKVYDGFLIHSRFGGAAALDNTGISGPGAARGVKLRADLRVPAITVVTETEVLSGPLPAFYAARQPDNDRLRTWEIAGAAHIDNYTFLVGRIDSGKTPLKDLVAAYAPVLNLAGTQFTKPINNAPQDHYVLQAALWHLDGWIASGKAPPKGAPLKMSGTTPPQFVLDANGNVAGGIRSPWVDVPTARLSGAPTDAGNLGILVGSAEPFDADTLKRLYPGGKSDYLKKFTASLRAAIKAGFILAADMQEILALAAASFTVP